MKKQTNKAKLEILKFLRISAFYRKAIALSQGQPLIKLKVIMPYLQILQKYAYQGIFACRIHICDEKSS